MFQRERHHTNSEQGGIRTVRGLCRLSISYKAIDLEDTHLSSFSCDRSLFFKLTNTEKNLHYHSACQSILKLLQHVTLELKQRVISGLFYFLANVVTVLGSFAKSSYPLLRANKVNIKSTCVLQQTDARDQVEAARLSNAAYCARHRRAV